MISTISTNSPSYQCSFFPEKQLASSRSTDASTSSATPAQPVQQMALLPVEQAMRTRPYFNFDDPNWIIKNLHGAPDACSYTSPDGENIIGVLSTVDFTEPRVSRTLSGKTDGDTQVSVSTILPPISENDLKGTGTYYFGLSMVGPDGTEFTLDIRENVRVTQTKEGNAVFYERANTTRVYTADGSYTELEGDIAGEDADSVYVLVSKNSKLTTGNGNNTVFVYGNDVQVSTGNGNNTVITNNLSNAVIDLGGGNNTVKAEEVYNSQLTMGDGNNTISFEMLTGDTRISAGDGNNTITGFSLGMWGERNTASIALGNGDNKLNLYEARGGTISFGDGANVIELYRILDNATLLAGNGNNIVNISEVGNQPTEHDAGSKARLVFGDGNNKVQLVDSYFNSEIFFGNGSNIASIARIHDKSHVAFGDGNNTMAVGGLLHNSTLTFGKGENAVSVDAMWGNPLLHLGAGTAFVKEQLHQSLVVNDSGSTYLGGGFMRTGQEKANTFLQQHFGTANFPLLLPDKLEVGFQQKYIS